MECEKYFDLIDDFVEGDLGHQAASYINSHLLFCHECKNYYETLKREREIYENYFEIETSTDLWTQLQSKLEAVGTKSALKTTGKFAAVFHWKQDIFKHLRLTPTLVGTTILIFGIGIGLLNFLFDHEISENVLVIEAESIRNQNEGGNFVETIKDKSQISVKNTGNAQDYFTLIKKMFSENRALKEEIAFGTKAKRAFLNKANSTQQLISAKEKKEPAKNARPNGKVQARQLLKDDADKEVEGDFYALPFAGISEEPNEELQILRVDLPRSTLFALGLNLPLEGEDQKVKTDLLVGSDGVTRAIRLVK